jgi:hypothetical protein
MTDPHTLLRPNQPPVPQMEDITGFDPNLEYIGLIGSGGHADVYLVTSGGTVLVLHQEDFTISERRGKNCRRKRTAEHHHIICLVDTASKLDSCFQT